MSEILFAYEKMEATTWAYLSSLLMVGLFFKFNRFWSVRNADLMLLILLAPGLLLVHNGGPGMDREGQEASDSAAKASAGKESGAADGGSESGDQAGDVTAADADDPSSGNSGRSESGVPEADDGASETPNEAPAPGPGTREGLAGTDNLDDDDAKLPLDTLTPSSSDAIEVDPASRMSSSDWIRWLGYMLLLGTGVLLLLRLLVDPTMVRRPLLEPNLTTGGLTFIGCSLFLFLMANVINSSPAEGGAAGQADEDESGLAAAADGGPSAVAPADTPAGADEGRLAAAGAQSAEPEPKPLIHRYGPGYVLLNALPQIVTMPSEKNSAATAAPLLTTTKIMTIVSHLLIVLGMVAIGYRHFGNLRMGIGGATLYLMLPYTAVMTGAIEHAAPAALLTWAIVFYRRPLTAGVCLGLAGGMIYYPLFVLPLWISFYWQRGMGRFILGLACALAVMVAALAVVHFAGVEMPAISPLASFWEKLRMMFGILPPRMSGLEGVWVDEGPLDPIYRIPIIFAFVALSGTFAIWPAQKNLGTLLSCTTAMMVAAQCWHGYGGGVYMAWYLPSLLMTFLRPNLEDRVALSVLSEGWFPRRSRVTSLAA